MALFRRKTTTENIPPELAAYYNKNGWRVWLRRILGIVILLAVLAAIAWAALWVYDAIAGDKPADTKTTTETNQKDTTANDQKKTEENNTADKTKPDADKPTETKPGATAPETSTGGTTNGTQTTTPNSNTGTGTQSNPNSELIKTGDDTLPATGG